jgi:hypothetical protein
MLKLRMRRLLVAIDIETSAIVVTGLCYRDFCNIETTRPEDYDEKRVLRYWQLAANLFALTVRYG